MNPYKTNGGQASSIAAIFMATKQLQTLNIVVKQVA